MTDQCEEGSQRQDLAPDLKILQTLEPGEWGRRLKVLLVRLDAPNVQVHQQLDARDVRRDILQGDALFLCHSQREVGQRRQGRQGLEAAPHEAARQLQLGETALLQAGKEEAEALPPPDR